MALPQQVVDLGLQLGRVVLPVAVDLPTRPGQLVSVGEAPLAYGPVCRGEAIVLRAAVNGHRGRAGRGSTDGATRPTGERAIHL